MDILHGYIFLDIFTIVAIQKVIPKTLYFGWKQGLNEILDSFKNGTGVKIGIFQIIWRVFQK